MRLSAILLNLVLLPGILDALEDHLQVSLIAENGGALDIRDVVQLLELLMDQP